MIKNCPTCLAFRNRQPIEPAIRYPDPREPWTKIAADLFWLHGHYYLLVVDHNSKFVAVENFKDSQFLTVINKCKKISQYSTPKKPNAGKGPEFTSSHFKKFSKCWDFKHQTVSSHYRQSNGLVERSIQIVNRTLKNAKYDQQDKYLCFLVFKFTTQWKWNFSNPKII